MDRRNEFSKLLHTIAPNVYFMPNENIAMKYPCIVYERAYPNVMYSDNFKYKKFDRYQVTVIDRNADSSIANSIDELKFSSFDREFVSDGLIHHVFTIYF